MVGNLGALEWSLDKKINARVDYSLNIFNQYTMNYLLDMGAEGVCLSPELNFIQLENFKNLNKAEILVHGEIILMVSDFCMLSSVLGNEEKMCPGYCRKDSYYIKDQKGYKFPVETDNYCRFYVFNSRTLCMIENIERILLMGPESIRIEARRYNKNQVAKTVKIYSEVLNKVINREKPDLTAFKEELQTVSLSPFTKGHYFRGVL
jgi:putative protease